MVSESFLRLTRLLFASFLTISLLVISGCSGSRNAMPMNMPEICQDMDFDLYPEMRKDCKPRFYNSHKNQAIYRMLTLPKGGKIVKKGDDLELRLPDVLPSPLPSHFKGKISFSEPLRRDFIKTKMDYQEFSAKSTSKRVKIMRLDIPLNDGTQGSTCFNIPPKPAKASRIQMGYAFSLESITCATFEKWKREQDTRVSVVGQVK
jgi:hypothetical protein